jgi:hypothetical protein
MTSGSGYVLIFGLWLAYRTSVVWLSQYQLYTLTFKSNSHADPYWDQGMAVYTDRFPYG